MKWKFKILISFLILFLLWIFVAPFVANNLIVEKPLEKADAILVLSGSKVYVERTHKAAEVYKNGVSKRVLLSDDGGHSGWSQKEERNPKFVELAKRELISQGVLAEDIEILLPEVTGTIYEAKNLRKKIKKEDWTAVMLVSSAYHTKRVLWTFERIIDDENVKIGVTSPPTGEQTPPPFVWWLSVKGWKSVAGEYVKLIVYWLYY